jgi:hypothetical protein
MLYVGKESKFSGPERLYFGAGRGQVFWIAEVSEHCIWSEYRIGDMAWFYFSCMGSGSYDTTVGTGAEPGQGMKR